MGFQTLNISSEYRSLRDDIVRDFYIPLLRSSVLYKRAVGFFSSSALAEMSNGITGLIRNNGYIQLVASPYLSDDDVEAIRTGYELRTVVEKSLLSTLTEPRDHFEEERLNLLAGLIADERLDIRIAFTERERSMGMYHEKMGLMYDSESNIVAFSGSMNESRTAMLMNYESIDVYVSWDKDSDRVKAKEKAFDAIWENIEPNVETMDFPRVKEEILHRYKRTPVDLTVDDQQYRLNPVSDSNDENESPKSIVPNMPSWLKLHDYQKEAIDSWEQHGYRGIFDMATGTGKTLTGLGAVVRLSESLANELAVIIVCPYQHLVEQWVEDIEKFNISPIIGYSHSRQKDWKKRLANAIRDHKLRVRNRRFFCLICTNATFSSTFVQEQLSKIKGNALLLVDEAHNFGASKLSELMPNRFNYRLALSATFERHRDEEGTLRLKSYFGEKCIEYSLERAICEHKLTPYKYYPILVHLEADELELYNHLSQEIGKCLIVDKNGNRKLSDKGERLVLKRARLVAAARSKLPKLRELMVAYLHQRHLLVYCGAASLLNDDQDYGEPDVEDIRQIDAVTGMLGNEMNMKVSQFTSKEDIEERDILKKKFEQGENLQALIAIKCLDEGVNIPNIKVAFILASTTNPKEYIQRRGRVLRLADGKDYAEIYDFVTTPRPLKEVPSLTLEEANKDLSLIKNELNRVIEFARISLNAMEADDVIQEIRDTYSLHDEFVY